MRYIGGLRGAGVLALGEEHIARANYDFDAYQTRPGEITGSGEIRAARKVIKDIFGMQGLSIITDDGRTLRLRFTEKQLRENSTSAHVDVVGELKVTKPQPAAAE
jgi:hypothetical protein